MIHTELARVDTEHISGDPKRSKGASYCSLDRGGQAGICGPSDKANPGEGRNPGAPYPAHLPGPSVTPVRGIKASRVEAAVPAKTVQPV